MRIAFLIVVRVLVLAMANAQLLAAQQPQNASDSLARLNVQVRSDSLAVVGAMVSVAGQSRRTSADGNVTFQLPRGTKTLITSRLGFSVDTTQLELASDTTVVIQLVAIAAEMSAIVVSSTRAGRRVEDTPIRVEVVDEEEVAEKVAMTPGDIAMLLNETSGLRVQTTSPSLGAAGVRVQGLKGRYTLILADGLPLYGGQAGGLGLLQIPPVDLARVEVIKGTASALYGTGALGGVVNLITRQPEDEFAGELLLNQTTRGGTDAVAFLSSPLGASPSSPWLGTLLVSGHRQAERDLDSDAWADMPGYDRLVARPRLFYNGDASTAFFTLGVTTEDRTGGTIAGGVAPDGQPFPESLASDRFDAGFTARFVSSAGNALGVRGSFATQRHRHGIGAILERDRHDTWFGEATLMVPRGTWTHVLGAALERDSYRGKDLPQFDYSFVAPSLFVQSDVDAASWLSLSTSARLDMHNEYGTSFSPRFSLLVRGTPDSRWANWNTRLSIGSGTFAPVPFTDETDAAGLSVLASFDDLDLERALSTSLDVSTSTEADIGELEFTMSVFASRLTKPVSAVERTDTIASGATRIDLVNAPLPTRTAGFEVLGRLIRGPLRITASYAHINSTEWDAEGITSRARRSAVMIPANSVGVVASFEEEERFRAGLELYYTGTQELDDNPYRTKSKPYLIVGFLAEKWVETPAGSARVFLNLENIGNVRQTRYDPLVLPERGLGGRWTTDAWTELGGFTANAGVRFSFP